MNDFSTTTSDLKEVMQLRQEHEVLESFMEHHKEEWKGDRTLYVPLYGKVSKGIYTYMRAAWFDYGFVGFISNDGKEDELRQNAIENLASIVIAVVEEGEDMKKLMLECANAGVPYVIFCWIDGVFRVYLRSPVLGAV